MATPDVRYVVQADEEELTTTVETVYLGQPGEAYKVRIASSDNKTTHWLTVAQARDLANALGNAAAFAAGANLNEVSP